jgi:hypothetical protein
MQGFDYEKARVDLEIPDNFDVMINDRNWKERTKEKSSITIARKRTSR